MYAGGNFPVDPAGHQANNSRHHKTKYDKMKNAILAAETTINPDRMNDYNTLPSKPLESTLNGLGAAGFPFTLFRNASELRLGYEIVRLAENPTTRDSLRLSGREGAGIGIDSDLSSVVFPQEVITRLGDYHGWSALHRYNWPIIGSKNHRLRDAIDKVTRVGVMQPDDEAEHIGIIYATSDEKIKALEDPQWREYVKLAARGGVEQILEKLPQYRQKALEELAYNSTGQPVIEPAVPGFDAIERLLKLYIEQMGV